MGVKTLLLLTLLLKLSSGSTTNDSRLANLEHLKHTSIMFALTIISTTENITAPCLHQLSTVQAGILDKKPWAMKMLDSSGQKLPGFLFGQNHWLGYREICLAAQDPVNLPVNSAIKYRRTMNYELLNEMAPFDTTFTVIFVEHNSPWQVELKIDLFPEHTIGIGLCVPSTCRNEELKMLMERYVESELFMERDIYEFKPVVSYVKELKPISVVLEHEAAYLLLFILTFSIALVIIAYLSGKRSEEELNRKPLIKCFDLRTNLRTLFDISGPINGEIPVINGLRTFTAMLVVFLHVGFFGFQTYTNNSLIMKNLNHNAIILGLSSVDFFFTISGFLQAYKFFSNPAKIEAIKEGTFLNVLREFFKRFFHRWLRLAPAYYVTICIDVLVNNYISNCSVYHIGVRDDLLIRQHWWRYLTFTQAGLDVYELIANWTWSMACEMQFFVVGTILLLLYARNPKWGKSASLMLFGCSIGSHFFNAINSGFHFKLDDFVETAPTMYLNPTVRCIPYFIGGYLGWHAVEKPSRINEARQRFIIKIVSGVLLFCLSPLINRNITSSLVCALILIVFRVCLAIWTAWIILADMRKQRTWLASFMGLKIFRHFGRLSYAVYLLNPLVIGSIMHINNFGLHVERVIYVTIFFGAILLTYFAAIGFSLVFEMPYCNLSSFIQQQKQRKIQ